MKPKFVVVHRQDLNNVGDMASNPLQYFLGPDDYTVIDVVNLNRAIYDPTLPMIVGGGGLIGNEFMGNFFDRVFDDSDTQQLKKLQDDNWSLVDPAHKKIQEDFKLKFDSLLEQTLSRMPKITAPRFIWGAGHNGGGNTEFSDIKWPKAFSRFRQIGIRDYHPLSKYQWVPCASCMHPALSKKYPIRNDIIWFEHKKQLIKDFGNDSIPRFANSGSNIEQTIELLGSANIILTNSYHGAYWGILLKKRVVVVGGAWSSKFKFFKHQPTIVEKKDHWRDALDQTPIFDSALGECRDTTQRYWNIIQSSL